MPPSTNGPEEMLATLREAVKSGDVLRAVPMGLELTRVEPNNSQAWALLSRAWERIGCTGLSLMALERLAELEPDRTDVRASLVKGNVVMGRPEQLLEEMELLHERLRDSPRKGDEQIRRKATFDLAETCLRIGRLEEARSHLADLTDRGFTGPRILMTRAKIDAAAGDHEGAIDALQLLIRERNYPKGVRLQAHFELAKLLDRQGDYDQAFKLVTAARSDPSVEPQPFDRDGYVAETDRILKAFGPEQLKSFANSGLDSDRAVFIVGMPRSGTTLTEQIIAAHSGCDGIGERREPIGFARILAEETGTAFPECSGHATEELLSKYGTQYLGMLEFYTGQAGRVTNKALGLDRVVGFISMLLPRSRVVFVSRNPLDNILSTYLHPLRGSMYPWTRTLEDIALVRKEFDRLVTHWSEVLDLPVFQLDYDRLTESPEPVIRGLIEHLGIPFEDECLAFHRTKRLVMTPSFDQVDKPINRSAVNRWRNYEQHLAGIIDLFPQ